MIVFNHSAGTCWLGWTPGRTGECARRDGDSSSRAFICFVSAGLRGVCVSAPSVDAYFERGGGLGVVVVSVSRWTGPLRWLCSTHTPYTRAQNKLIINHQVIRSWVGSRPYRRCSMVLTRSTILTNSTLLCRLGALTLFVIPMHTHTHRVDLATRGKKAIWAIRASTCSKQSR